MKFVFLSYTYSANFSSPESWLTRIEMYSGVYEWLAKTDEVNAIHQIDYTGDLIHNGVQYHFVNLSRKNRYFPLQLNQFVSDLHPDIVVVHGLHQPFQLMQLRFRLLGNAVIIVQHHAEKPFTGVKKYLQRIADPCVDAYLFTAATLGHDWIRRGNLSSIGKIHEVMEISSVFYPMDKQLAWDDMGVPAEPFFIWVGRLNDNKDPLNVVRAFLKFTFMEPSARLYMIYHTDELLPEISCLLNDHVNGDAIIMVGQLLHDDLLYWFNAADFILSGSHYEGSGTAVCEAMSCGCIPIVTDIFSFRMITDEGKCGILYQAGNEGDLLDALISTTGINRQEKRRLCLDYFRSHLSFEAIAKKIHQIAASFF